MFLISKIIWIVGQPLSVALFLCILALIAIVTSFRRLAIALIAAPILLLFVVQFTTTGGVMIQALEDRFPRPTDPDSLACMIVLGGGFTNDASTVRGGYEINDAGDRFIEALRLARKYPEARILISGGDGFITGGYLGDAAISERLFSDMGVSKDRLILEETSRTTFENAINTKALLEKNNLSHCLLITSGYHMPRSVGIFRKLNMDVVPWVVDYRSTGQTKLGLDMSQPEANSSMLTISTKEWIGMIGYYLAGRTSSLYPGP